MSARLPTRTSNFQDTLKREQHTKKPRLLVRCSCFSMSGKEGGMWLNIPRPFPLPIVPILSSCPIILSLPLFAPSPFSLPSVYSVVVSSRYRLLTSGPSAYPALFQRNPEKLPATRIKRHVLILKRHVSTLKRRILILKCLIPCIECLI